MRILKKPEISREAVRQKHRWINAFFARRQHPIKLLSYISKNIWLLLIPLTKYLIATKFDFQNWIRTNWLDILTLVCIFAFAFLRWVFVYYEIEDDGIIAHSGLFGMLTTKVYYNEITTFSCCQGYAQRLFKACTMYIETNARSMSDSDVKLVLRKKSVDDIFRKITAQCIDKPKMTVQPKKIHLLVFSLLFSSTISGVILFSTFLFELYRLVGREIEEALLNRVNGELNKVNSTLFKFTSSIPKIILIIAFVTIGGWLLSFLANLMRYWKFKATRCGSQFIVESGILTKRKHVINRSKVNYLDYQKSLLMKLFKICSVTIHCTGYGVRRREISVLIPITTSKEARRSLKILEPDVPHTVIELKTGAKDIPRFLLVPVVLSALPPALGAVAKLLVNNWHTEIDMITIFALVPFLWKIIVSIAAAFNTSVGFKDGYCSFRYCYMFKFHKIIIPKENVSKAVIMQTWFQKVSKMCSLKIYTNAEKTKFHILKNLPLDKTRELCQREGYKIYL